MATSITLAKGLYLDDKLTLSQAKETGEIISSLKTYSIFFILRILLPSPSAEAYGLCRDEALESIQLSGKCDFSLFFFALPSPF